MQDRGAGQNSIVIRGLSSDPQADLGTAGVYFGEVPLSGLGSASSAGSAGNVDIKLVDIDRVEVLRGPQGTLYGSDSMAGTVRVIPVAPNLEKVEGKLSARYSQTGNEGGDNTMIQAVLNLPLIENQLAVRGVAYRFENGGYINNVAVSQPVASHAATQNFGGVARDRDDVGNDRYTGFRLTTQWRPIDELDITLGYTQQEIEQDGSSEIDLELAGDYEQRRINTGLEGNSYELIESDVDITNLVVNYSLAWGTVSSSSSWVNYNSIIEEDKTYFSDFLAQFFGPSFAGQPFHLDAKKEIDVFVEELRLSSDLEGNLQFVLGLYYEDKEESSAGPFTWSGDIAQNPGDQSNNTVSRTIEQQAFFGELSYAITDQFTAVLGGRYFDYKRDSSSQFTFLGFPNPVSPTNTDENGQTYKVNLSYTPNDDILLYGQWAEGFRLGRGLASNTNCAAQNIDSPSKLESDTSENIELGFKASLADNRLTFNASVYSIDWEGIPVLDDRGGNCRFFVNAGKAKSEGVELEFQGRLNESLQVDMSMSYGESILVGDSSVGEDGDNLPGSADFNASLGVQYDFMVGSYDSFARVDYSYIGEYYNSVNEGEIGSQPAGGFGQFNLKGGVVFDRVAIDVFVNNLNNDDGLTWVETVASSSGGGNRAYRIRPRTIGLNLQYQF
jgi:outer membrane receptor protein involved in Fe transport